MAKSVEPAGAALYASARGGAASKSLGYVSGPGCADY